MGTALEPEFTVGRRTVRDLAPFRLRVDDILLPANVPAGCNPFVLMSLAYMLRSTNEDPDPVTVRAEGERYRLVDGRHRFLAAVIAGRSDILATIVA